MKELTVKDVIALLQKQDPKAKVVLEGCDCEASCVGLSVKDKFIILRQERGVYDYSEELPIETK